MRSAKHWAGRSEFESSGANMTFELKSPAFPNGGHIPVKYTADGENLSPPLEWSNPPSRTKSFALVVEDPDAPTGVFRHWGLYNLAAETRALPEGLGEGRKRPDMGMAFNDFGRQQYGGPAPPKGHGIHHYHFKLLALDAERLTIDSLGPSAAVADLLQAADTYKVGEAELVGTYER
jgi:Raf kinase inhibitor-like YbhB/YbcL family protein